jgi:hypothetical protein
VVVGISESGARGAQPTGPVGVVLGEVAVQKARLGAFGTQRSLVQIQSPRLLNSF